MRARTLILGLGLLLGCGSSAARQASSLYDKGDYRGAAALADEGLARDRGDDSLWQVRIRALLAQGDPAPVAAAYQEYRTARGSDDRALVADMATATLAQGLESTSIDVRVQTIGYIEKLELEPLARDVMDQMQSDDDRVAAAAAVAVLRGHPQAPGLLEELQRSDDPLARAIAVEGIGRKVGKYAADDLRTAAADPEPVVRIAAMNALASVTDDSATRSLAEAMADADPGVRAAAARSLAIRGRGDLAAFARTALADPAAPVRLAGIALLVAAKDDAGLRALLTTDDPLVAIQVAAQLHGADAAGATRAIDGALGSPQAAIRAGAINVMQAALGKDAAIERARARLTDPDPGVQLAAARLLAYLGLPDEARPVMVAALSGPERLAAAADLAQLGDERGLSALSAAVLATGKANQRIRAAQLHGSAHRITPGLVAALADASGAVRVVAAFQLITIANETAD